MKNKLKLINLTLLFSFITFLSGCQTTVPKDALKISKESLETRQLQTRKYEGIDEEKILSASAGVIQDLGFNIDESETSLGVIVGSKNRDATEVGQVVAGVLVAIITGISMSVDDEQRLRVSLVVRPINDRTDKDYYVRATFQRTIWDTNGQISRIESINEPNLYEEFFAQLSKSIFLEGQKI